MLLLRTFKIVYMYFQPIQKFGVLATCWLLVAGGILAQERKVAPTSAQLFKEIAYMDSVMFNAFNKQDMVTFKALFTEDLEWFQDNGGLINYTKVFENFERTFRQENKLSRSIVKGSLEVHPIKDYGAIEIGAHTFKHLENGKLEEGTFKFLMIWRKRGDQWQISRVISYDH
jgi:ketosteroid isomerase-like protein